MLRELYPDCVGDDVDGSGMVALANTVDAALQEFSIDSRGCLAKSICTALYDKECFSNNRNRIIPFLNHLA